MTSQTFRVIGDSVHRRPENGPRTSGDDKSTMTSGSETIPTGRASITVSAATTSSDVVFDSFLEEPTLAATKSSRLSRSTGEIGSDGGSTDWPPYFQGNQLGSSLEKSNSDGSLSGHRHIQYRLHTIYIIILRDSRANRTCIRMSGDCSKSGSSPRTVTPLANDTRWGSVIPRESTPREKHSSGTSPGALPTPESICADSSAARQP